MTATPAKTVGVRTQRPTVLAVAGVSDPTAASDLRRFLPDPAGSLPPAGVELARAGNPARAVFFRLSRRGLPERKIAEPRQVRRASPRIPAEGNAAGFLVLPPDFPGGSGCRGASWR